MVDRGDEVECFGNTELQLLCRCVVLAFVDTVELYVSVLGELRFDSIVDLCWCRTGHCCHCWTALMNVCVDARVWCGTTALWQYCASGLVWNCRTELVLQCAFDISVVPCFVCDFGENCALILFKLKGGEWRLYTYFVFICRNGSVCHFC